MLLKKFDVAKEILDKDIKRGLFPRLKDLVSVYKQSGYPFQLIRILKRRYSSTCSTAVLKILVNLYWSCGMVEEAIKAMKKLERKRALSVKEALLYSEMLYSQRKYEDSLAVLKRYMKKATKKDIEFWQTLSDLAWAERDYLAAIKASRMLYEAKQSRAIDYERLYLFYYYSKNRPEHALRYAIEGYRQYGKPYLFFAFLNTAAALRRWDLIIKEINKLERKKLDLLSKKSQFTITYATALIKTGNVEKGKKHLEICLSRGFNAEVLSYYIYVLLEMRDTKGIKDVIKRYKKYVRDYPTLLRPFISCYLFLQDGKRAMKLVRLMAVRDFSDMLLRADILSLLGKQEEAGKIRFYVWKKMKHLLRADKERLKNKEFLENFLRVAMYFESSSTLRRYMRLGERILDKDHYRNLILSYLLYIGAKEKAEFLIKRHHYPSSPWMRLALYIWRYDKPEIKHILEKYADNLPIRDKVEALKITGKIDMAIEQAFSGLNKNRYDSALWEQLNDLVSRFANHLSIESHYLARGGYKEFLNKNSLRFQKNGLFIELLNKAESKIRENKETIRNCPSLIDELKLSIKKTSERWTWTGYIGMLDSLRTRSIFGIKFKGNVVLNTHFSVEMAYNKRADDTLFLYIGGMKRCIDIQISKSLLSRLLTTINIHYNRYYSQDDKYLGYGIGKYLEILYMLRLGYPDAGIRLYLQHETYDENQGNKGVIARISPYGENPVLPGSFNQIGIGIIGGYQNREKAHKKWRPFFKLDTTMNDETGPGLSVEAGISTPFVVGNDNFDIGISYIRGFRGTEDNYYDFYIKWKLFF